MKKCRRYFFLSSCTPELKSLSMVGWLAGER